MHHGRIQSRKASVQTGPNTVVYVSARWCLPSSGSVSDEHGLQNTRTHTQTPYIYCGANMSAQIDGKRPSSIKKKAWWGGYRMVVWWQCRISFHLVGHRLKQTNMALGREMGNAGSVSLAVEAAALCLQRNCRDHPSCHRRQGLVRRKKSTPRTARAAATKPA